MVSTEVMGAIVVPNLFTFTLYIVNPLLTTLRGRKLLEVTFNNRPRNEI